MANASFVHAGNFEEIAVYIFTTVSAKSSFICCLRIVPSWLQTARALLHVTGPSRSIHLLPRVCNACRTHKGRLTANMVSEQFNVFRPIFPAHFIYHLIQLKENIFLGKSP